MNSPIVFTHYGNASYLRRSLICARLTNPKCQIILLGDDSNRQTAVQSDVEHFSFRELVAGPERQEFGKCFKPISGRLHQNYKNGGYWLRYVFERWFYVYEYACSKGFESFWHFDSDTMILAPLSGFERTFQRYDCTEQCNGMCMNGYIHLTALRTYLDVINDLFMDECFLDLQRREFERDNPHYAFTEMRAYAEAKRRKKLSAFHLSKVVNGTAFDDCICQDHGYETARLASGQIVKNLYWENGFYCFNKGCDSPIKFNTLNLSWVPDFVFDWVLERTRAEVQGDVDISKRDYLSSCSVPMAEAMRGRLRIMKSWAKKAIGQEE